MKFLLKFHCTPNGNCFRCFFIDFPFCSLKWVSWFLWTLLWTISFVWASRISICHKNSNSTSETICFNHHQDEGQFGGCVVEGEKHNLEKWQTMFVQVEVLTSCFESCECFHVPISNSQTFPIAMLFSWYCCHSIWGIKHNSLQCKPL